MVKLLNIDGLLAIPFDAVVDRQLREFLQGKHQLIVRYYNAGDIDTINWPDYDDSALRTALYDGREMGWFSDVASVTLPDGTEFNIDQ